MRYLKLAQPRLGTVWVIECENGIVAICSSGNTALVQKTVNIVTVISPMTTAYEGDLAEKFRTYYKVIVDGKVLFMHKCWWEPCPPSVSQRFRWTTERISE